MNNEGYQQRLALIEQVLNKFNSVNSQSIEVSPIDYDENCPFPYNNFLYKVALENAPTNAVFAAANQSFTSFNESENSKLVVVRICNPKAGGLSQGNRVENEVAAIYLAREGLRAYKPELAELVPCVYAWEAASSAEDNMGWILMDYKEGVQLDAHFKSLDESNQALILEQMADTFTGVQKASVPKQMTQLSGISIDADGKMAIGEMTTADGGPWSSYIEFWKSKLAEPLEGADKSSVIGGWKKNGTRDRIDAFISTGLAAVIEPSDGLGRVLVHGDFTMNNILVDPKTNKLTGMVDFDFASISHPAEEFFASFGDVGGNTGGWQGPDHHDGRLEKAVVAGDFSLSVPEDQLSDAARTEWRLATTWDAALAGRGLMKPSDIPGITLLARLPELRGLLCPFRLVHPRFVQKMSAEELESARDAAEKALCECLEVFGF